MWNLEKSAPLLELVEFIARWSPVTIIHLRLTLFQHSMCVCPKRRCVSVQLCDETHGEKNNDTVQVLWFSGIVPVTWTSCPFDYSMQTVQTCLHNNVLK